jgi:hypothetical protein
MTVTIVGGWLTGSLPDDTGREWPVVQRRQASARGPLNAGTPNLILHTTETDSFIQQLKFPSQWQCGDGQIGQHIQLGLAGDAVNNWDAVAQQIEMVGRSELGLWLPSEATLGPVVALTAWLHKTERIKTGLKRPAFWPTVLDKGPQAVEGYYRRHAGVWPDTPGVYGHVDIPDNSHWDPGSFDYPRFFARVQTALGIGDDDMGYNEFAEGLRANRKGDPLKANATPDWELGWRAAESIRKAAETPLPGMPAPHEHNLQGKAT